jgi:hypothetical protein
MFTRDLVFDEQPPSVGSEHCDCTATAQCTTITAIALDVRDIVSISRALCTHDVSVDKYPAGKFQEVTPRALSETVSVPSVLLDVTVTYGQSDTTRRVSRGCGTAVNVGNL